jgi:hypothetical protein
MATTSQRSAARAQKARRQKIIAAVLGGALLIVLVIQGPRTLKMLHGSGSAQPAPATSSSASASSTATPSTATPTAAPQLPVTATASAATVTSLEDSDQPPARKRTQLLSFDTFDSKDPFVQQVSQDETPATTSTSGSGSSSAAPAAGGATSTVVHTPTGGNGGAATAASSYATGTSSSASASTPTRSTAQAGSKLSAAVVDVNGKQESVAVAQSFPKANPTFRLVSLTGGVAKIGIAGGSYSSGAQTVALRLGHTLTLVNTSDGLRYELRLVSAR